MLNKWNKKEEIIRMGRVVALLAAVVVCCADLYAQDGDSPVVVQADTISDTIQQVVAPVVDSVKAEEAPAAPFHDHVQTYEIKKANIERQPLWLFLLFVFQLLLIGYLRISFTKSFEDLFKGVMNLNIAQQLYREQEQSMPISAILYIVNFVISGGIFLFLVNRHQGWMQDDTVISMLFFLWAVIVIYSLRYGSLKVVSLVFPFSNAVEHYNFNFFLIQKVLGLVLVPMNLLIAYVPPGVRIVVVGIAVVVIAILTLSAGLKGLSLARNLISRNAFHFFVYICTLEIAPVCILVKVVVDG